MQQAQSTNKPRAKTRKSSKNTVSTFISKTYEILEDNQFPDIVDWNFEGTAIVIKNPLDFAQKALNQYFKHRNLTSFVRQLNMYGFHKQRTLKIEHIYSHELFQRGKKHLLDQIKRKSFEQINLDTAEPIEKPELIDPNQDITTLIQEKQALKRYNIQAASKINNLEGKIKDLVLQNQILQNQISQQDERDKILISLMANLLRKYGIPPTELSLILKEDLRGSVFQQIACGEFTLCNLPTALPEHPIESSEEISDGSNFLNLELENGNGLTAPDFDENVPKTETTPGAQSAVKIQSEPNQHQHHHHHQQQQQQQLHLQQQQQQQVWGPPDFSQQNLMMIPPFLERRKDKMMMQGGLLIKPQDIKLKGKEVKITSTKEKVPMIPNSSDSKRGKRRLDEKGSDIIDVITKKRNGKNLLKENFEKIDDERKGIKEEFLFY